MWRNCKLKRKGKKKKKWLKLSQSPIGMFKDESSKCPSLKHRLDPLDPNLYPYYMDEWPMKNWNTQWLVEMPNDKPKCPAPSLGKFHFIKPTLHSVKNWAKGFTQHSNPLIFFYFFFFNFVFIWEVKDVGDIATSTCGFYFEACFYFRWGFF